MKSISVYRNCKCNHIGSREGLYGTSGCMKIDTSIRAAGLSRSGSKMTSCELYTDENCQNKAQSIGIHSGQTYGCTAFNQDTRSIKCNY